MAPKDQTSDAKNPSVYPDLLDCLVFIGKHYNQPKTKKALTVGLPLVKGNLTPELFLRAASKLGLNGFLKDLELENLREVGGPCVILLNNQKAGVLVKLQKSKAEVYIPSEDDQPKLITQNSLKKRYSGKVIVLQPEAKEDSREGTEDSKTSKKWFWGTLSKFWTIYSQAIIASFLINTFTLAGAIFTLTVYDRVVPYNAFETLWVLVTGILVIFGFDFILRSLRSYFIDLAGKNAGVLLASMIFERVMGIRMEDRPSSAGSFANQLREFESLREVMSSATLVALADLPFLALFLFIVWIIGGIVVLAPLILIPIVIIMSYVLQGPLSETVQKSYKHAGLKHALLIEALQGAETIKGLNAEGKLQNNWERFVNVGATLSIKTRLLNAIALNFSLLSQNLTTVGVLVLGVYQISENLLTLGGLIACIILTSRAMAPLTQVVSLLSKLNQSKEALKNLNKIVELPVERPKGKSFLNRPNIQGGVEFRNVTFSYPDQSIPTLNNLSFKIKPGEKVALLGAIGSGKSTIEKIIMGLYQPQSGSVLIDGIDINQLDPVDVRESIDYIPQDIFLFFGSIKDNIGMRGNFLDDETILKAAVMAGAHKFIRKHPQGYGIVIKEGGGGLSGGQRQTIAVARALTGDPALYLFDEPTAMMDQNTEKYLIQQLKNVIGSKSLILVTHRPSLISLVDRLIIIDGGKVVADGPKDQVIEALKNKEVKRKDT